MRTFQRFAWVGGVAVLILELLFVWIPAGSWGGELNVEAAVFMTLLGFGLILTSVITAGARLNRETNGGVVTFLKVFGAGYFAYKSYIGVRRHIHQEITRDD